jgi:hypothetical protein
LRTVQDGWGWSHMSHSVHVPPRNTFTPRWARIVGTVQDSGMVSHVSHSVHVPPKETFTKRWARIVDSPG